MAGEILDNKGRGDAHWSWPSIHPEGRKFGLIAAAASIVCAFLAWETIAWPLAFVTLGVLAFFRDPERVVPQDERMIVSPADGMVSLISQVEPPAELMVDDGSASRGLDHRLSQTLGRSHPRRHRHHLQLRRGLFGGNGVRPQGGLAAARFCL